MNSDLGDREFGSDPNALDERDCTQESESAAIRNSVGCKVEMSLSYSIMAKHILPYSMYDAVGGRL